MRAIISLTAALAATLALGASLGAGAASAEGRLRDSDDWVCNHGPVSAPDTLGACQRLRGEPLSVADVAAERDVGRLRNSDDYNCHHGARGDPRTLAACANLRRDVPGEPGSVDPAAYGWLGAII